MLSQKFWINYKPFTSVGVCTQALHPSDYLFILSANTKVKKTLHQCVACLKRPPHKNRKGPPYGEKGSKNAPHGEKALHIMKKAPHMVKKVSHNEKDEAKWPPYEEKVEKKLPYIEKIFFPRRGGGRSPTFTPHPVGAHACVYDIKTCNKVLSAYNDEPN